MRKMILLMLLITTLSISVRADEPKSDVAQDELEVWQGLWQLIPGGIEHRNGKQIVRQPPIDGPCFFVLGDRLVWLDDEGKPTGKAGKIVVDAQSDPKRVTLMDVGSGGDGKSSQGIYSADGSKLVVHFGLGTGPAPKQFLEFNKPVNGVDGREWLISRKKLRNR